MVVDRRIDGGSLALGHYQLLEKLGSGTMGEVYLARHVIYGHRVAIKVIHDSYTPIQYARFEREAHLMASVSHPNIVRLVDYGAFDDERPCIAMEFIDGDVLGSYLSRYKRLNWTRAANIAAQIADGLSELHAQGIVHRDIKPDNIIYTSTRPWRAKLLDLGIARGLRASEESRLTAQGVLIGTPAYMAPEQLVGDPASAASDIYALGILLYESIYGELLFGETMHDVMLRLTRPARPPAKTSIQLPDALQHLLFERILATDPADRICSAIDLEFDLLELLHEHEETTMIDVVISDAANESETSHGHYKPLGEAPPAPQDTITASSYRPDQEVLYGALATMLPSNLLSNKANMVWFNEHGWNHEHAFFHEGNFWFCIIEAPNQHILERKLRRLQSRIERRYGLLASTIIQPLEARPVVDLQRLHAKPLPEALQTMVDVLAL